MHDVTNCIVRDEPGMYRDSHKAREKLSSLSKVFNTCRQVDVRGCCFHELHVAVLIIRLEVVAIVPHLQM